MNTPPKRKKPVLLGAAGALTGAVFAAGSLWPDTQAAAASDGAQAEQRAVVSELKHWPAPVAKKLAALIAAQEHRGAYAVFDADNTSYRNDLEESLLPFLEMKGVLTRDTMDPSLKIIPFEDTAAHQETLAEYYARLCEIDDQVSYPWAAQIFSGFTLKQLKGYVDELLAYDKPLPGGAKKPEFSPGMQELYRSLTKHGIEVYVVSAAHEDLVRMVLADPKHGYAVKPENVLGVSTLLKDRRTGEVTSTRKEIAAGRYDAAKLGKLELTPTLWAPATWYEGKPAAISTYVDPWRKPVLAAGDTPKSDGPMLLRSTDVAKGGLRVWVNRKDSYMKELNGMKAAGVARQKELGQQPTADKNWLTVTPQQIG
ncbi:HAD family hydrolase [Streptomyces sp. NBC_00237]|uniref:HAD family hydrolase n=1 Tax=Streptomyces sp. NBC_00237 TaxID=2975687 RepID=UPI002B1E1051|nr:HAD family hydrolase [Streptomyces sp. NBC_00237]